MYTQLTAYIRREIKVTDEQLAQILACFKPLLAKKNEILVDIDQTNQRMFFVREGCLRKYFTQVDGQEATSYIAFENMFATALTSFIAEYPSTECIQALEPAKLLYISRRDFYRLLDNIPVWERFYRAYLEMAYVNNTRRLMSFATMDALERYRELLHRQPVVVQRLPSKIVASYLNISQETLSRLKVKV